MQGGVTGLKLNHAKFFEISGNLHTIIHFVQCFFIVVVTLLVSHFVCLVQYCAKEQQLKGKMHRSGKRLEVHTEY